MESGRNYQNECAIAIGNNAGQNTQQAYAVAIGNGAGQNDQQGGTVAIGSGAGQNEQRTNAIAIGNGAGQISQQESAVAIGNDSGLVKQGTSAIAIGVESGRNYQNECAIAIGNNAGQNYQQESAVAIGNGSGQVDQQGTAVAIGYTAGQNDQRTNAIAIGNGAGQNYQQESAVAIGNGAGKADQQVYALAIGILAGQLSQQLGAVAIGAGAGQVSQQGGAVAIGYTAGQVYQGNNAIAIGNSAGMNNQPDNSIIINASNAVLNASQSGFFVNPIRNSATTNTVFYNATTKEITYSKTTTGSGSGLPEGFYWGDYLYWDDIAEDWVVGSENINIGQNAGRMNQHGNAIAIGANAGEEDQGNNAIAIGNSAGKNGQPDNSIIINASGDALNASQSGFFVEPIRNDPGTNTVFYNATTKEITYSNKFSSVTIEDVETKPASPTSGSLTIKHKIPGGSSSIVFPSAINPGSDCGYIQYDDYKSFGGENNRLTIGTTDDDTDELYLSPSGGLYVTSSNTNFESITTFNKFTSFNHNVNFNGTATFYKQIVVSTGEFMDASIYFKPYGGGWGMTNSNIMFSLNDKVVYTGSVFRQGELGGGFMVTTNADPNWKEYVSNLKLVQQGNYVEMTKYNNNRTTSAGAIGINYFNSDQRLKENIKEPIIKNVCQYIEKIEFKSFQWKRRDYSENDGICELGVIAQQLEFVHPDLVNTMSDVDTFGDGVGTKAVNTNAFSTFMMKGIQELIAENKNLKEEAASLKSDMQKIKDELTLLTNAFSRHLLAGEPGIPTNK